MQTNTDIILALQLFIVTTNINNPDNSPVLTLQAIVLHLNSGLQNRRVRKRRRRSESQVGHTLIPLAG